ncbi:MAG: hypothetical protein KAJ19_23670 [Gammaproteobacteria bacterium]|nr:hypothetical protein [Gammaproteobacteria bacterium]
MSTEPDSKAENLCDECGEDMDNCTCDDCPHCGLSMCECDDSVWEYDPLGYDEWDGDDPNLATS